MKAQQGNRSSPGLLRIAVLVLALTGAAVSARMLRDHGGDWEVDRAAPGMLWSLCESAARPSMSCAEVVGSRWGSFDFFVGGRRFLIPTSFVGLAYFLSVGIWFAIVIHPDTSIGWLRRLTLAYLVAGLVVTVFLVAVMRVQLSHWCPLCLVAHVANVCLVAAGGLLLANRQHGVADVPLAADEFRPVAPRTAWRRAGAAVAVIVAVVLGTAAYDDASRSARHQFRKAAGFKQAIAALQNDVGLVTREFYAQPLVTVPLRHPDGGGGRDELRPSVVIFEASSCRASRCFEKSWQEVFRQEFAEEVDIERRLALFHRQPGQSEAVGETDHMAIEAAEILGGAGARSRMHALLFGAASGTASRDYAALARSCGLPVERFMDEMRGDEVRGRVQGDIELGERLGVSVSPAVFLNGRRVPDLCLTSHAFWRAVGAEGARHAEMSVAEPEGAEVPR